MSTHLIIVDGSAYIHRAFHSVPRTLRSSDGMNIGAVKGYCEILWALIRKNLKAYDGWTGTHLVVVFDHKSENFRHRLYPLYKANRPPIDDELREQLPLMRDATRAFGVPSIELEGHEADDIIATLARNTAHLGIDVTIVSSDKDLTQLVGPLISMWDPLKKIPPDQRFDPSMPHLPYQKRTYGFAKIDDKEVHEKFGVYPCEMGDYLVLLGDKSDNIPGLPGVGAKTAVELIERYGNLEAIIAAADEQPKKRRQSIIDNVEQLRLSRKLVTLDMDVPVELDWTAAAIALPRKVKISLFLERMGLVNMKHEVLQFIAESPVAYVRKTA
jgi:DNA polymerase-1